jgi:hypothetical protein
LISDFFFFLFFPFLSMISSLKKTTR